MRLVKSYKVGVLYYISATIFVLCWPLIMPCNATKNVCEKVELYPMEPGTIVFIDTSTFYNHVLIYGEENTLVESPNPMDTVKTIHVSANGTEIYGEKAIVLQLKDSTEYNKSEVMQKASEFAMDNLSTYYDINFVNNKNEDYSELNCSELIWGAYMVSGIDIDSDGGIGVYPNDIVNSQYFEVVDVIYPN